MAAGFHEKKKEGCALLKLSCGHQLLTWVDKVSSSRDKYFNKLELWQL